MRLCLDRSDAHVQLHAMSLFFSHLLGKPSQAVEVYKEQRTINSGVNLQALSDNDLLTLEGILSKALNEADALPPA